MSVNDRNIKIKEGWTCGRNNSFIDMASLNLHLIEPIEGEPYVDFSPVSHRNKELNAGMGMKLSSAVEMAKAIISLAKARGVVLVVDGVALTSDDELVQVINVDSSVDGDCPYCGQPLYDEDDEDMNIKDVCPECGINWTLDTNELADAIREREQKKRQ